MEEHGKYWTVVAMRIIFFLLSLTLVACTNSDWRTASRQSSGLAPKASEYKGPIVQIYVARAFSWRGIFAVHPWIAWKAANEEQYTIAEVVGWRVNRGLDSVVVRKDLPDRKWYGSTPEIVYEVKGDRAIEIIKNLPTIIKSYPYINEYRLWPGPNSNTFIQYVIRSIPELKTELPANAIGKDWPIKGKFLTEAPSNTGHQFSLYGVLGLTFGRVEGVEFNLLGLSFGLDPSPFALKLPFIGRLGASETDSSQQ